MKNIAQLAREIEAKIRDLNVMGNRVLTRPDVMLRIKNDMSFSPSPAPVIPAGDGVPVELRSQKK